MHVTTQKAQRRRAYAFLCHGWVRLSVMPVLSTMLFVDRVRRSQRTPTICNTQSARCRLFTLSPLHAVASSSTSLQLPHPPLHLRHTPQQQIQLLLLIL